MPFAKLDEFDLYYEMHGAPQNPALVLIPGFASGAWIWQRQVTDLSERFLVIVFDPRGVSKSKIADNLANTVSVKTIAADVVGLLSFLNIERAHVAGAGFGGFVAQEFALNHAASLNRLILICTTAGGKNHVKANSEVLRSFAPNPNLTLGEHIRQFLRPAFSTDFAQSSPHETEAVCLLREANPVPETVYAAQLKAAFTFDSDERLSNIKAATLVVTGDEDNVVPAANSKNLARRIPDAKLCIVKNGGHLFFIEKAAEFNLAILKFLNGK